MRWRSHPFTPRAGPSASSAKCPNRHSRVRPHSERLGNAYVTVVASKDGSRVFTRTRRRRNGKPRNNNNEKTISHHIPLGRRIRGGLQTIGGKIPRGNERPGSGRKGRNENQRRRPGHQRADASEERVRLRAEG